MDAASKQHARRSNGERRLEPGREPERRRSGGDAREQKTSKYKVRIDTRKGQCTVLM